MSKTVNDIISTATPADLDIIREFIRDTVRAEWGTLIQDVSNAAYPMPADPFLEKGPEPTERASREYDLECVAREEDVVTFQAEGLRLKVARREWESAGSPNRIHIVASVS